MALEPDLEKLRVGAGVGVERGQPVNLGAEDFGRRRRDRRKLCLSRTALQIAKSAEIFPTRSPGYLGSHRPFPANPGAEGRLTAGAERHATDYDEIFARLAAEQFDAVYVPGLPFNNTNRTRICQLALRHRIPAVSEYAEWARCGLLLTYSQDASWSVTRGAEYIDKILRGAKPSDLPVEQATKFLLTINLKTAKELGLTVPPSLIARADEVIE